MAAATRPEPWIAVESDNLTGLTELNERTLLASLKERYARGLVYTDVGDILVAVNPFRPMPFYDEGWSAAYARPDVSGLAPHVFKVAARAYNSLVQAKKDQVCVISGESGAGKTESAKYVIRQAMGMCTSAGVGHSIQQKIIELNPLLEAFGNAQTALNDNSSRFGKFIQLVFQPNGRIMGAGLDQYLLEKSRLCVQGEKERNFHIFYFLFAGLTSEEKQQLHLKNPTEHHYLNSYKNLIVDCSSVENRAAFAAVLDSMRKMGFTEDEISDVRILLAAVLLIGDIEFEGDKDRASIKGKGVLTSLGTLLHLTDIAELEASLTTLQNTTRGETVVKCYSPEKAGDVRDALAKALYSRMFHWIVMKINLCLQPEPSDDHLHIGILDIFGFENFALNSFEQLCINLANEQLQQYFNHQIFAMEKVEYAKEGLKDLEVSFNDNTSVLNLFLAKPGGLLSQLDEQCKGVNGTDKAFVQRCKEHFKKNPDFLPHKGDGLEFSVKHFAGTVLYQAAGFLDKNKDSLPDGVVSAVMGSRVNLVTLVMSRGFKTTRSQLKTSIHMKPCQRKSMRLMSHSRRATLTKQAKGKFLSVGNYFRESLELLMERIFAATPHFVRCIKPNQRKSPNSFDNDYTVLQLRYTGMLEAVRVRKEGFSYRPFFSDFCEAYKCLAYDFTDKTCHPSETMCQVILQKAKIEGWRLGHARVFLRYFHQERLLLLLKELEDKAIILQKVFRGHRARKRVKPLRETQKREKAQVCTFLQSIEPNIEACFERILVLNKIDIQQAVTRFGNNNKEYLKEMEAKGRERRGTNPSPVMGRRSPNSSPLLGRRDVVPSPLLGRSPIPSPLLGRRSPSPSPVLRRKNPEERTVAVKKKRLDDERNTEEEEEEEEKKNDKAELSFTAIDFESDKTAFSIRPPEDQLFDDIAEALELAGFHRGTSSPQLGPKSSVGLATSSVDTPISIDLDTDLGGIEYQRPLDPLPSKQRPKAPRRLKATSGTSLGGDTSPISASSTANLSEPLGGIDFATPLSPLPSKGRPVPARRLKKAESLELLSGNELPVHCPQPATTSRYSSPRVSVLVTDEDSSGARDPGFLATPISVPLRPHSAPSKRASNDQTAPKPPPRPSSRPSSGSSSRPASQLSFDLPSQLFNNQPATEATGNRDSGEFPSRPTSRPPSVANLLEGLFSSPADDPCALQKATPPPVGKLHPIAPSPNLRVPPSTGATSHQDPPLTPVRQEVPTSLQQVTPPRRTPPSSSSPLLVDKPTSTVSSGPTGVAPVATWSPLKRKEVPPQATNGHHTPEVPPRTTNGHHTPEVPTQTTNGHHTPEVPPRTTNGHHTPEVPTQTVNGSHTPVMKRTGVSTPILNRAPAHTPEVNTTGALTPSTSGIGGRSPSSSPGPLRAAVPQTTPPVDRRSLGSIESMPSDDPTPLYGDKRYSSVPNDSDSPSMGMFRKFKALRKRISSEASSATSSTPGLYSDLCEDEAVMMITGEPKGTYLLCAMDDTGQLQPDKTSQNVVYRLLVSEGKSNRVHQLSVVKANGGSKLCVENATPLVKLPDLESLLQHYKRADLPNGVRLLQPLMVKRKGLKQTATPKESPPLRWMERVRVT